MNNGKYYDMYPTFSLKNELLMHSFSFATAIVSQKEISRWAFVLSGGKWQKWIKCRFEKYALLPTGFTWLAISVW